MKLTSEAKPLSTDFPTEERPFYLRWPFPIKSQKTFVDTERPALHPVEAVLHSIGPLA
jgi:hypothetical protein